MKFSILYKAIFLAIFFFAIAAQSQTANPIYHSDAYSIYADGVTQGKFSAKAISSTELTSDYQSQNNQSVSSDIEFKFSINGKDNEMKPGVNHHFNLAGGAKETPLVVFGQPLSAKTGKSVSLQPNTSLKIRLDLRNVLAQIKSKGFFTTFKGEKIFKEDFKHVYIAGATAPLSWDFDNLHQHAELEMKDPDHNGIYETTMIFNAKKDQKSTAAHWKLTKNTAAFPQYSSDEKLSNALYNMALEEMTNAVEPDSTFRTGKEWAGVWTRDISYSIILSMAYMQPKVAMKSLMRKVNANNRIIQDTGTGGAYPCSTDRMIWATAAWEVFKATGERKWLEKAYDIIKNSIADDEQVAYDTETGLVRGESSFLDWREQTYPKWMQPADIYESENLGTNAVHYQANIILSEMAKILKFTEVSEKHKALAEKIKSGINTYLWMPEKGYYAQYLYGRNFKSVSPKSEALGEALCILFGIADSEKAQSIIEKTPVMAYGIPCVYPQIPGIAPYHNDAVWPFVQSYWALASAKAGNGTAVAESIAAIDRAAALFLTNKENFVAGTGDFAGTQINSSNMLWSLSGNIAMVHKVIFGIEFGPGELFFHPFVPENYNGTRTLTNFKYRGAILDITIEGTGNKIKLFTIDDHPRNANLPSPLKGKHRIKMVMESDVSMATKINKVADYFSPETPFARIDNGMLTWEMVEKAVTYKVIKNGKPISTTAQNTFKIDSQAYAEFQVIAVDQNGIESFASEPVADLNLKSFAIYEAENASAKANFTYQGFTGSGFIETSKTVNPSINFEVEVAESGNYAVDFRYANGNGPINTENKCAIRSLNENENFLGTLVFPQRGVQEWSNWGFSNSMKVHFEKGKHVLTLILDAHDENMNGSVNQAMLDCLRVIKME